MAVFFNPSYAQCDNSKHSASKTTNSQLDRVHPMSIVNVKLSGLFNVVALDNKDMRLAVENSKYSSCGQRLNGHCHLGKKNGKQQAGYAMGQAKFEKGNLKYLTNLTGTYRPEGVQDGERGAAHMQQMGECFIKAIGLKRVKGVEYRSYGADGSIVKYEFFR